ncbi:hypothetical protein [Streptomyces indicus]|uniref:Large membrane protein n=1 Tax=Streptomyces indicus TaxID=417292 RepID=A0A1G8YSE1_9ACTN|nr:hypothetical protein [Streptomyces indicus]SDK05667.1 hypothetical protein SAMN05421806_104239 [Streptomyces indicus]
MSSEGIREETRGPRSRLVVASVAAAVLLAGGGGAYLATSGSSGGGRGDSGAPSGDAPPPLTLDGYTPHAGGGEPVPGGAVFTARGELPEAPESVPVYRASGEVSKEQVGKLADALGMQGEVTSQGAEWRVGTGRNAPLLTVAKQAPGTWTYAPLVGDPGTCPREGGCDKPVGSSGLANLPPVDEAKAKAAAAPVLKALGQDDAKLDARQTMGAARVVNADPVVDGLPTYGVSTGIQVGPDGEISGASGQLAEPVKGVSYPVIGADEALKQLSAASTPGVVPGKIGGCASAVPHEDELTVGEPQQPCEPGAKPAPPKPQRVAVESAVLGLAAYHEKGRQVLVPAWLFSVAQAGAEPVTVTHPAVAKEYLRAPAPLPSETVPSEPGGPSEPPAGTERPTAPVPTPTPGEPEDGSDPAGPQNVKIESYETSGRTLTVHFWAGVCSDYTASVKESGDRVTVTVTDTPQEPGKYCIMIAKEQKKSVQLEQPLGEREVVGADGARVPRK